MEHLESPIALILEDDEAMADALRAVLDSIGLASSWQRTVEDARRVIESRKVAIVLLDLQLEGEHRGRHLLDDLASLPKAPPMLVVSGSPDATAIAAEFGVPCVQKPFNVEVLTAAIEVTRRFAVRPIRGKTRSGKRVAVDAPVIDGASEEAPQSADGEDRSKG